MSYQCRHDVGWFSIGDGVQRCIVCDATLSGPQAAAVERGADVVNHSRPRPNLRLIRGGKEERDVHDRDLPGGAA